MTDQREALADRIRKILDPTSVVEKRMFGTIAFMIGGHLAVTASREGVLLVRADPDGHESHVERGARQATMGTDRSMGRAWLEIAAERIVDDADLEHWVGVGVATATNKGGA